MVDRVSTLPAFPALDGGPIRRKSSGVTPFAAIFVTLAASMFSITVSTAVLWTQWVARASVPQVDAMFLPPGEVMMLKPGTAIRVQVPEIGARCPAAEHAWLTGPARLQVMGRDERGLLFGRAEAAVDKESQGIVDTDQGVMTPKCSQQMVMSLSDFGWALNHGEVDLHASTTSGMAILRYEN